MGLSADEIKAIQSSMATVNQDVQGNIAAVYKNLFTKHPAVKPLFGMFQNVDAANVASAPGFEGFATKFGKELTDLTNALGNDSAFKKWVQDSVARHIPQRKVQREHYKVVFDIIAETTKVSAWSALGTQVEANI